MRKLLLILAIYSAAADADRIKESVTDERIFASLDEAVVEMSSTYNPPSIEQNREYIGIVAKCSENKFKATVAEGRKKSPDVSFKLVVPEGCTLEAFWHTHARHSIMHDKTKFSAADTNIAIQFGVPIYMVDPKGTLRVFKPEDKRSVFTSPARGSADGTVVKRGLPR